MEGLYGFKSDLRAKHFRNGICIGEYNLGSGKVTEHLVAALVNDQLGTTTNKAAPILAQLTRMYSGTGTVAETAYDYGLGTPIATASGAITPTIGIVAASNNLSLQWVGTIAYTGTSAVTEWGLFNAAVNGSQYNTSLDAFTATTATPTTSPAWTANQWAGYVAISGAASGTANNSGAGYVGGVIISNTATAITIGNPNWYAIANAGGSGSTPGANTRFDIWPMLADRKTFAAINVVNTDSIQFTYTLTAQSGG